MVIKETYDTYVSKCTHWDGSAG